MSKKILGIGNAIVDVFIKNIIHPNILLILELQK